jgi:hypothetical protein
VAPPGGVIDPARSDARRLIQEGLPARGGRPLVLSFRTPGTLDEVVDFYVARRPGLHFSRRTLPLGERFPGVEMAVARAAEVVAGGHRAVITASWPGADPASNTVVHETTVEIEIL